MGVETWRTLLHYKQDSNSKDTNKKKSSLFIIIFYFSFLSVGYGRHATRHRWFVTTEFYLVVAWVPCGSLPNAKVHWRYFRLLLAMTRQPRRPKRRKENRMRRNNKKKRKRKEKKKMTSAGETQNPGHTSRLFSFLLKVCHVKYR
jgi:hypothetical protein